MSPELKAISSVESRNACQASRVSKLLRPHQAVVLAASPRMQATTADYTTPKLQQHSCWYCDISQRSELNRLEKKKHF